jgi:hypothetical protein
MNEGVRMMVDGNTIQYNTTIGDSVCAHRLGGRFMYKSVLSDEGQQEIGHHFKYSRKYLEMAHQLGYRVR